jgi:16S rRNA A1518/A1519 N6-dimethyltransferase RsmA/KsgA/DIM1 with predicted DNA glycosylase/AP lyase activity
MAQQLQELEARTAAENGRLALQLQAEQAERERLAKQMADLTTFLQSVGQSTGVAVPPTLFAPPPPVLASPVSMKPNCFD